MDWRPLGSDQRLYVLECEVARLCRRIGGTWYAVLDQHLPYDVRRHRDCTNFDTGKAGIEAWAIRHRERLEREVAAKWEAGKDRV